MFLMNFYGRQKSKQDMKRKIKRQHEKIFFKTALFFILSSGENLLLPMSLCGQIISGLGYFVPHGCLQQCFLDDLLIKAESCGASKVFTCRILICGMVGREAALILLLILQIFPANFKIYAEMDDLFSMLL